MLTLAPRGSEQVSSILKPFAQSEVLPTVDEIVQTCRVMHHFKLMQFAAPYVVQDPNDPFWTHSEALHRVEAGGNLFNGALAPAAPFRRLFRTESGFLGLGPQSLEVGDGVWIPRGAKAPFVLRERVREQSQGKQELIGETYLHGFMTGEKRGGIGKWEEIEID
jgi:hypothetical protein